MLYHIKVKGKYIMKMVITHFRHMTTYPTVARGLPHENSITIRLMYIIMPYCMGDFTSNHT